MRRSNRATGSGVSRLLVCLALPGLLAAGASTVQSAAETTKPDVKVGLDAENDLERRAQQEARDREQERLRQEKKALQLVAEYIVVGFQPDERFAHAGNCSLPDTDRDEVQPTDIAVLIEGECHGRVGETIQMTLGSYEISVDVVNAAMQVVDIEDTMAQQPMVITVPIDPKIPTSPIVVE